MFCKLLVVAIILPLAWTLPSELQTDFEEAQNKMLADSDDDLYFPDEATETFKDIAPPFVEDMNLMKKPNRIAIEASLNEDKEETDGGALESAESMEEEEDTEDETLTEQSDDTIVTTNEVTDSITQDDTTLPNVEVMSSTFKPIWTPNPEVDEGMKSSFKKAAEGFAHKPIEEVEVIKDIIKKTAEGFAHNPIEEVEGIKDVFKKAVEGIIKFLHLS